jgi:hypothetical protein
VGHKCPVAVAEHNPAWNQIRGIALVYCKDVAGPGGIVAVQDRTAGSGS